MAKLNEVTGIWQPVEEVEEVLEDEEPVYLNKKEEKSLIRKIDWVIIPFLSLLYL
jgi:hypothetical protein